MRFQHWRMYLQGGQSVTIQIDTQCDVFLVDDSNLSSFRRGGGCTYYGGNQTRRLVTLTPPHSGHWNLVLVPMPGSTVRFSQPRII